MAKEIPTAEIQISGIQDDGTAEGIVRSKIVSGELARVSINYFQLNTLADSSVTHNTNCYTNPDGSGYSLNLSSKVGIGTGGVTEIRLVINGPTIILRYRRQQANPPFAMIIDGEVFRPEPYSIIPYELNVQGVSIPENEGWVIARNLGNRPHTVILNLPTDASTSKTLEIYGFYCEKSWGYKDTARINMPYGNGILTASAVAIPRSFVPSATFLTYVKSLVGLRYHNTDSVTRTVTVSVGNYNLETIDIAAGKTGKVDFPNGGIGFSGGNLTHQADASGVVKFYAIGAQ